MSMPRSVAEVIDEHVELEVECIDRMTRSRQKGTTVPFGTLGYTFSGAGAEPSDR